MRDGEVPEACILEFRIFMPKYDNSRNPIRRERLLHYVKRIVAKFGGGSVFPTVIGFFHDAESKQFFIDDNLMVSVLINVCPGSDNPDVRERYERLAPVSPARIKADIIDDLKTFLKTLSIEFGREFGQVCIFQAFSYGEETWCPPAELRPEAVPEARLDPKEHVFLRALEG